MRRVLAILRKILRRTLAIVLAGLLLLLAVVGYFWFSTDLPNPNHLRARAARGNTRLLDRNGHLLYEVPDPFSGRQRPLALEEIPIALRQATIALEDRTFYQNPGVDLRGIARAAWRNLSGGAIVAGGSTITQQLARNFLLDPHVSQQRTLERKLRETVLALKLTATFSKDEILAMYLNQTYYGGLAYGVEAAAQHFFGKPARELDLAECALLAGLPQAPSYYNPATNREAALARQGQVLNAMVSMSFITDNQAEAARTEPLQFAFRGPTMRAPHVVAYMLDMLAAHYGPDTVARGGLVITTTIDVDLQHAAQTALQRQIASLSAPHNGTPGHRVRNGAIVVLDPENGAILAMVGSPDFFDATIQGQVNGALARRQPGSAIKPLTYAAALERGYTPASRILDEPAAFPTREGRPYRPENYDRTYHGEISLREALATSSNVAAVRVLHTIGIPALLEMASRLGIASLGETSGEYGLALTLGSGEVTLLELTAAYGAFANGGNRLTPYVLADAHPATPSLSPGQSPTPAKPQPVLSPQVAFLISSILSDPYARMRTFGTTGWLTIDRPAAVKTGTTGNWHDGWTVGYTPDRVVGVWVGNADGEPMRSVSGAQGAAPVWHEVMLAAHRNLPPKPFAQPDGIVERMICTEPRPSASGNPTPRPSASEFLADCPSPRQEYFIAGTQPEHREAGVSHSAPEPARPAPAAVAPPHNPAPSLSGIPDTRGLPASPRMLHPAPGARFALTPAVPRERQHIALQARAGSNTTRLTIVVDGEPVATCNDSSCKAFWPLLPGTHHAHAVAHDGQGDTLESEPVVFHVSSRSEF